MKKAINYLKQRVISTIVSTYKKCIFYTLKKEYMNSMVRRLNEANQFKWESFNVDTQPQRFSDLLGLFMCSPLNRGILRQDIDEALLLFETIASMDSPVGIEIGRYYESSTIF